MISNDEDFNEILLIQNNKYILTNLSEINREEKEQELIKIFKFFNINNLSEYTENNKDETEEQKIQKFRKKEKIRNLLLDSLQRTDILLQFLTELNNKRTIFEFKILKDFFVDRVEKAENNTINYYKKLDFFDKSIEIFNKKLKNLRENKDISQIVFRELILFKKFGFLVDENYRFPEISQNITTNLIYKTCLNYEHVLGKEKVAKIFTMNLIYNTTKNHFDMKYEFYDNFTKKFTIHIFLVIKLQEKKYVFNLDQALENLINSQISNFDESINKYGIKNYIFFIFKYCLYKMMKREIIKINELTNSNFFEIKNFGFHLERNNNEFSVNSSYLDILESEFKVIKTGLNTKISDIFKNEKIEYIELNKKEDISPNDIINNKINQTSIYQNSNHGHNRDYNHNMLNLVSNLNNNLNHDLITRNTSFTNSSNSNHWNFRNNNIVYGTQNNFSNGAVSIMNMNRNAININNNQNFSPFKHNGYNNMSNLNGVINFPHKTLNTLDVIQNQYNNDINDGQTKSSNSNEDDRNLDDSKNKYEFDHNLILNFIINILNDLKSFKNMKQLFYKILIRNHNLINNEIIGNSTFKIEELFDNTIFSYNLKRYNNLLLQKFIVFKLDHMFKNNKYFTIIKTTNMDYIRANYMHKYNLSNNMLNFKLKSMEVVLHFNKNKINMEVLYTHKNSILIFDKDSSQEIYNKKIDFNMLFEKIEKFMELNR